MLFLRPAATLVTLVLCSSISQALTTSQAFDLIPNGQTGGCNAADVRYLDPMLPNAARMAGAAVSAINTALRDPNAVTFNRPTDNGQRERADRKRIVEILRRLFQVTPTGNRLRFSGGDKTKLTNIRRVFEDIVSYEQRGDASGDPWKISCGDGFLQVRDTLFDGDPENPQNGPNVPVRQSRFAGGIANLQNIDFMWYYDNGFRGPDPQGWSYVNPQTLPKPPGSANNFRWTRAGVCTDNPRLAGDCYHDNKFRITMFCPLFFNGQAPQTGPPLPALRARTIRTAFPADGAGFTAGQTTLDEAFSMAGEFLHEMTHQLRPGQIRDGVGYGQSNCFDKDGEDNADSYALLATALFYSNFDWSSGIAEPLAVRR